MTLAGHGVTGPDGAGAAVDLDATLACLDAVVRDLGAPPADRDAVLWAAHEFATCAWLLVGARDDPDAVGATVDYARSAMACLTIARRQDPVTTNGWSTARS